MVFYLACLKFKVFNKKKLWEMIGDESGYVTGDASIRVAIDKNVVNKCHCTLVGSVI